MREPSVIGFYGLSNSGKTNLITDLVEKLSNMDLNVVTVKKTDKKISVDQKGKDTWKHAKAGAKIVVFSSPVETSFMIKQKMNTNFIIDSIKKIGNFDFIFIEGCNDINIPKIKIGDIKIRENTFYEFDGNVKLLCDKIIERLKI